MATKFTTGNQKGLREDLANFISDIVRDDTPFMASIGKTKATAIQHEWSTDALEVPGVNSASEGSAFPSDASNGPEISRLSNKSQIFTKSVEVSGTIDAVNKAGRKSEFKYQSEKRGKEIMRDIEFALVSSQQTTATTGSGYTSGRVLGSVQSWVPGANTVAAGGTITTGATGTTYTGDGSKVAAITGAAASFTLVDVDAVMQACYENGGKPTTLMMSPKNKRAFSVLGQGSGSNVRRNIDDSGKLRQSVEIYDTDFGAVKVVPNYIMGTTGTGAATAGRTDNDILAYDPTMFKMATLRPLHHRDISEDGDRLRALMIHETTLECKNPYGSGRIGGIS